MNHPHNDDYLHTQLSGYRAEEPAPAHHLPFDRISPAEPALGAAGEFGEYMPQSDLAGTAADTSGETPASDPAADGDDEDVHVAHAADVEVHGAVTDETREYGEAREEQAPGVEEHKDGEPGERHAHEGEAADVEVPRAVVNETHAHGVDLYEEPAGDAAVHDAAASEWQVDEASVAEGGVPGDVADEVGARSTQSSGEPARDAALQDAVASESSTHSRQAADVEVQLAVADERDVHDAGTYQEPAESEDEEQAAVLMQAGPPDATMEESDVMVAANTAHETPHDDATGASESLGANGAATAEQALPMASGRTAVHPAVTEHVSSAGDARGMLEGVAQSLRTLAGRDANGEGIAIFPRGVDVLEVRMHISRDRDIDLNFRVAGPAVPSTSI